MRRTRPFLLASLVLATPLPAAVQAAAQVTVDPNALNALGSPSLPAPPPAKTGGMPAHRTGHKNRHPAATAAHTGQAKMADKTANGAPASGLASTPEKVAPEKTVTGAKTALPPAGADTENKANLGSSFTTVPVLPGAAPALPAPPKITLGSPAVKNAKPPKAAPAPTAAPAAAMPPLPASAPPPVPQPPALPAELSPSVPPAPTTPAPTAAKPTVASAAASAPAKSPTAAQSGLPPGADVLTLPYAGQDTGASGALPALIRDFVTRHGATTLYVVRAYASQPKGDDDPSTQRRIALTRAQGVQAALMAAGVDPIHIRLLALGHAAQGSADRVDLVAMPPLPGHGSSPSSP